MGRMGAVLVLGCLPVVEGEALKVPGRPESAAVEGLVPRPVLMDYGKGLMVSCQDDSVVSSR